MTTDAQMVALIRAAFLCSERAAELWLEEMKAAVRAARPTG